MVAFVAFKLDNECTGAFLLKYKGIQYWLQSEISSD